MLQKGDRFKDAHVWCDTKSNPLIAISVVILPKSQSVEAQSPDY